MPKDTRNRVQLTFTDSELRDIDRLCKEYSRWLPRGTCLRNMLLDMTKKTGTIQDAGCSVMSDTPQHSTTPHSIPPHGDARPRESSTPEKNKSKKDPSLAPLAVSVEILEDLSAHTGKQYKPKLNGKARELIAHRMAQGATLDDFKEVHRKKAQEWLGTDWAKYLRPSTLYGTKFGEYLAQPEKTAQMDPAIADVMRRCGVDPGVS